jgi:hypothetical protein
MEVTMTDFDHRSRMEPDPRDRTTPRRAVVGAASVAGIIAVMFGAFYAINAQRSNQTATAAVLRANQKADVVGITTRSRMQIACGCL